MLLHSLKNNNEVIIITLKKLMPAGIRAKVSQIQAVNTFLVFLFGAFIFLNSDEMCSSKSSKILSSV